MDALLGVFVAMIIIFVYFIPGTIAVARNHKHTAAVVLVNLLFGWTFLGWAIALIWSVMNQRDSRQARTTIAAEPTRNAEVNTAPVTFRHDKIARADGMSRF
jgi:hypothetical protein